VWNRCQEKSITLEPPALLAALLRLVHWSTRESSYRGVAASVEPLFWLPFSGWYIGLLESPNTEELLRV
jgi:hypothetical protein